MNLNIITHIKEFEEKSRQVLLEVYWISLELIKRLCNTCLHLYTRKTPKKSFIMKNKQKYKYAVLVNGYKEA